MGERTLTDREIIIPLVIGVFFVLLIGAFAASAMHNYLLLNGSSPMEGNLNMSNYNITDAQFGSDVSMNNFHLLDMHMSHLMHFTLTAGATDVTLEAIPSGFLDQDRHFQKLGLSLDQAAGVGKWVNVTLTDGTDEMIVSITGTDTNSTTTTGAFDLDVSAETLTLKYSESAGSATTKCSIAILYHYKINE